MWMVRLALDNLYGVIVFALFILVLGFVALLSIPVDILPTFNLPAVQVLTYFNGMPAGSVEKTITNRIERWVNQAPAVRQVESRSLPGVSVVRVFFREEIDSSTALTLTSSLALSSLAYLPPNTLPPVVLPFDPTGTLPLGIITVNNANLDEANVKDLARIPLRNMLGGVKGTVSPVVVGGKDRTILFYLDPRKLQTRRLSPTDVVKALQDGNLMVTPGTAYFGDNQVLLDTNAMVESVAELNKIPIRLPGGELILLEDVGTAEDASAIQTSRVRINGRQQVYVPIYRQGGASSLAVAEAIKTAIPKMEERLEEGTKLTWVMDQSEFVRKAIDGLIEEGVVGIVLVSVMILLFLGDWKMTLIACLSLPLALLGTIIGLRVTGNTINVMTLGGMFLAIGPLIDDAIVVLENTHRHLGLGKSPRQAAEDATHEVTLPVLVATAALIIVLCPIALTPGLGGFLFKPLTLAVAFAMITSFILSRTFVPALCSVMLRGHRTHARLPDTPARPGWFAWAWGYFNGFLTGLNRRYVALLRVALRHRWPVLAGVVVLFVLSLVQLFFIGQEFFPQVDTGQMTLLVRAPANTRLDATERYIVELEKFLAREIPKHDRAMILSEIGLNPDWSAAYTQNAGQMDAVVRVQFTPERTLRAQEYAIKLRHALREAGKENPALNALDVSFDTGGMVSAALNFGSASPIDIQIEGGTPEQAVDVAHQIRKKVASIRGAVDVRVAQRLDAPYLVLEVKRQKAMEIGLTTRDVTMQIVAAMNSSTSIYRNFWIDNRTGNQYFVAVQYREDPDRSINDLKNVFATGTNQTSPIPLSSLVDVASKTAAVEINHAALARVIDVQVNTENRDIGSVARDVEKVLQEMKGIMPRGVRVKLMGEYDRMNESFRSIGFGLVLAALLVYLLMVPLFRSFLIPLIIMVTVPLGLIGVLTILSLSGTTLNVQSEMGIIFLVGIVVSQGVLLLDFAGQLRREGYGVRRAVIKAASIRFRPILMTFLATFLDLLPMAIGMGKGSESLTPLARAVVGGLLSATTLTLFVVPILFTLLIRDPRPHKQASQEDPT
jgi:multidrug efflux pump subunit AcrB